MSFLPLNQMDCSTGNDIWGWTDPETGTEYALMGCSSGTSFVDLSDPANPVYLGQLPTHTSNSTWRDIKVYQDHAFVVSEAGGHGMQVFDLTRLRDVTNPPEVFTADAHYGDFGNSHNIVINEDTGFAYSVGTSTCGAGLHMVNIQDPVNPTNAGCFSDDGYTHDAQCVTYHGPDADYFGREICFNSNEDTLTLVDVTNKGNPQQISLRAYPGVGYTHQGWLTEDHRYFLLDDELDEQGSGENTRTMIFDVTNLDSPSLIGQYSGPTPAIDHNQYVRGGYSYQANYRSGLRILDITDVHNGTLVEAGYFDIYPSSDAASFNGAWSNYPYFDSGLVIVSGIEQGLFVLDPTVPELPPSVSIDGASVFEGDDGDVTDMVFPVSLSFTTGTTASVNFATADLSATEGVDYTATSGILEIPAGTLTSTITVPILGDTENELYEKFNVNLFSPSGVQIGASPGVGTIKDDDSATPELVVADASIEEGDAGDAVTVTIYLQLEPGAPEGGASVDFTTVAGTAEAGIDFVAKSGTVNWSFGSLVREVKVDLIPDNDEESPEQFFLTVSNASGAVITDEEAVVTILDDDAIVVDALDPTSGPASGSTIQISGQNFAGDLTVDFGEQEAPSVNVINDTLLDVTTPPLDPGRLYPVHVHPPVGNGSLTPQAHPQHRSFMADFNDVFGGHPFHDWVELLVRNNVTAGCGGGDYCPNLSVTRGQMAVFLLKGRFGGGYQPPDCTGIFDDVDCGTHPFADWIEDLAARGITSGCGGDSYCPDAPVNREQMAVFLLKAEEGDEYGPAPCEPGAETFGDVTSASPFCPWVEELVSREITAGCGGGDYCPGAAVTRGQMAVFLSKTFTLPFIP